MSQTPLGSKEVRLIEQAKARFAREGDSHWYLNEGILERSVTTCISLLDAGLLSTEDQVVRFSLLMATEVDSLPPPERAPCSIDLGPRLISIQGHIIGTCDNLSITIDEATPEEVAALRAAGVIKLIRSPKQAVGE